jgi:hypothetical protein
MHPGRTSFSKGRTFNSRVGCRTRKSCGGLLANGTGSQDEGEEAVNGVDITRALEFYGPPRSPSAFEVPPISSLMDLASVFVISFSTVLRTSVFYTSYGRYVSFSGLNSDINDQ